MGENHSFKSWASEKKRGRSLEGWAEPNKAEFSRMKEICVSLQKELKIMSEDNLRTRFLKGGNIWAAEHRLHSLHDSKEPSLSIRNQGIVRE